MRKRTFCGALCQLPGCAWIQSGLHRRSGTPPVVRMGNRLVSGLLPILILFFAAGRSGWRGEQAPRRPQRKGRRAKRLSPCTVTERPRNATLESAPHGGMGRTARRIRSATFVRAAESVRRPGLPSCRADAVRGADGEDCSKLRSWPEGTQRVPQSSRGEA